MATSNARKILEQVVTDIVALSLSGITSSNVKAIETATSPEKILGCFAGTRPAIACMIYDAETVDSLGPSPVEYDDIGYPVLVAIMDCRDGSSLTATDDDARVYRESIRRAFVRQRLTTSGTTIAWTCTVEHRTSRDPLMRALEGLGMSLMVLRFQCREART